MGVTIAFFHSVGNFPTDIELLKSTERGPAKLPVRFLNIMGGSPSGPQDVLFFSFRITFATLSGVKVTLLNSTSLGTTFALYFYEFLHTMYKYVLNSVVKISMMCAKYFEYYTIILRERFWGHVVVAVPSRARLINKVDFLSKVNVALQAVPVTRRMMIKLGCWIVTCKAPLQLSDLHYCDVLMKMTDDEAKSIHCLQDSGGGRNLDYSKRFN